MKAEVVLGLGSSLGDRAAQLRLALGAISALEGVEVRATSSLYSSTPLGAARQPFLNGAVRVSTSRSPRGLLAACQAIERRLGRRPSCRWADRRIDIDLLLWADRVQPGPALRLPHPELLRRPFALEPAREVAPELIHPLIGRPLGSIRGPRAGEPGSGLRRVGVLPPVAGGGALRYTAAPPRARRGHRMKIFLDTANLDEIREAHSWGVIDGVTTNPSLIAREGKDFVEIIHEICGIVRGPVSAETVAQDVEGMVREGRLLAKVSEHVVVKVPLTRAGISATKVLSGEGIDVNVTLCFSAGQALLAAKAGAAYVSPFVGRLDDISQDGVSLIEDIVQIYGNYPELGTEVLAASIRDPIHMLQVAKVGCDVATLPFKVLARLFDHPLTVAGNAAFLKDWATVPDPDVTAQVTRWLLAHGQTV